jgi:hypothetical protein
VNNSPILYTDPSGHVPTGENDDDVCLPSQDCWEDKGYGDGGGGGGGNNNSNSNGDQSADSHEEKLLLGKEENLFGSLSSPHDEPNYYCTQGLVNVCLVIMPPGTPSNNKPPNEYAEPIGIAGGVLDILETITAGLSPFLPLSYPLSIWLASIDVGVTAFSCWLAGECYIDSPGYDLPSMGVVNSDMIVTVADLVIGTGTTPIGDVITSLVSIPWDFGRATGEINNYVSMDVSLYTPENQRNTFGVIYIMVYP